MKTNKNSLRKWLINLGVLGVLVILFASCRRDYLNPNNNINNNTPVAAVSFLQASPDQPTLDFALDANQVNNFGINFGDHIDYFRAFPGARVANFYATGTTTKVFSGTVTLTANTYYSLILANKTTSPEVILLTDTLNRPASGMANIRFINLSPDAGAVDLVLQGSVTLVANKAYKGISSFAPTAGRTNITLEVHKAGTSTILASIPNINLNSGSDYTIWLQGLATPTGTTDGLKVGVFRNAFFF
jgi:hypothetical protein